MVGLCPRCREERPDVLRKGRQEICRDKLREPEWKQHDSKSREEQPASYFVGLRRSRVSLPLVTHRHRLDLVSR